MRDEGRLVRKPAALTGVLVSALLFAGACRGAEEPPHERYPQVAPPSGMALPAAPEPSSSTGSGTPPAAAPESGPEPERDRDKGRPRGNTPPGRDRSGGGPADGAIQDPSGAATGKPEAR